MIHGLNEEAASAYLREHLLDRSKFPDRVPCFLIVKQAGELYPAGCMGDGSPAHLIRHARGDGNQVGGAEDEVNMA